MIEPARVRGFGAAFDIVAAPAFRQALTVVILGLALVTPFVRTFVGWPGEVGALGVIVVAAAASLVARRGEIEWRGILPVSLLALASWMVLSVLWSEYTWASIGGVLYTLSFAFLGAFIALSRDLIQVVRALGDTLRAIVTLSLVLEIFAGILIDMPLPFLHITGDIALGGPIQGIAGTRNALGFLAGLAILTFWIELRTQSIRRIVGIPFLVLAGLLVALSRSPVTVITLGAVGLAGLLLVVLRRIPARRRRPVQATFLAVGLTLALVAWTQRVAILALLDATSDFDARTQVWQQLSALSDLHPVEGWGWVGVWPGSVFPFSTVRLPSGNHAGSALNAFIDGWFQLGLIGLVLLVLALGLGFVRSWLVASETRSTVNVWPALMLALLVITGMAESYLVAEGGITLAVVACIAAARKRSWRRLLRDTEPPEISAEATSS